MSIELKQWWLAIGTLLLGLVLFVSLTGRVAAAPPPPDRIVVAGDASMAGRSVSTRTQAAPVAEAALLGGAGLMALALVAQAERWR
jgi:hypothetical protein